MMLRSASCVALEVTFTLLAVSASAVSDGGTALGGLEKGLSVGEREGAVTGWVAGSNVDGGQEVQLPAAQPGPQRDDTVSREPFESSGAGGDRIKHLQHASESDATGSGELEGKSAVFIEDDDETPAKLSRGYQKTGWTPWTVAFWAAGIALYSAGLRQLLHRSTLPRDYVLGYARGWAYMIVGSAVTVYAATRYFAPAPPRQMKKGTAQQPS